MTSRAWLPGTRNGRPWGSYDRLSFVKTQDQPVSNAFVFGIWFDRFHLDQWRRHEQNSDSAHLKVRSQFANSTERQSISLRGPQGSQRDMIQHFVPNQPNMEERLDDTFILGLQSTAVSYKILPAAT